MKKALVIALTFVLGLGIVAFAGPLSGSWESELTIGFRDVTLTEASFTFTHPGGIYAVSQGSVTIPAHDVIMTYIGGTYTVTVPEFKVLVGPFGLALRDREVYVDCDAGTVTVCEGCADLYVDCEKTTPPGIIDTIDLEEMGPFDIDFGATVLTYGGDFVFTHQTASSLVPLTYVEVVGALYTQSVDRTELCCCDDMDDPAAFTLPALSIDLAALVAAYPGKFPAGFIGAGDTPIIQIASAGAVYDPCTNDWTTLAVRTGTCGGCDQYGATLTPDGGIVETPHTFVVPQFAVDATTACGNDVKIGIPDCEYAIPEQIGEGGCDYDLADDWFCTDLGEIYVPPFTGSVTIDGQELTYTIPAQTYAVSNQTVTIPPFTETVPGWTSTIEHIPTLAFTSTLIVDYTICGWVFNSTSKFDDTGWLSQSFAATGTLGAFSLASSLIFDPAGAAFTSWDSTVGVSIAGVAFDAEFFLGALGSGWTFGASGGAGDCDFGATVYFNMDSAGNLIADDYCFCFSSIALDISFPFTCIDLVDISIGFSTAGFDGITFSATGIVVPGLPWLSFDVDLTFDDGALGKEMTLTPAIDLGVFSCITLYYELVNVDGLSCSTIAEISGIKFYGIGLDYTWNGVSFSSTSSFDAAYNATLIGYADYWEVFTIASAADACCGGAFDFSVSTYFECESEMLFDWAQTSIKVSMGLGSNYTGWTGLTVTDTGLTQWKVGFKVVW